MLGPTALICLLILLALQILVLGGGLLELLKQRSPVVDGGILVPQLILVLSSSNLRLLHAGPMESSSDHRPGIASDGGLDTH